MPEIFSLLFAAGFVIDGLYEEYGDDPEIPVVMIVRARKDTASLP